MYNYLISGSKGFIGSNLLKSLEKLSNDAQLIFDFDGEIEHRALEDFVRLSDVIFHLGAISATDANDVNRTMFLNYEFSKMLFDLAQKYNKKVIYASSGAIYGNGDGIPKNLYAWTKKVAEDYGLLKVEKFISLRFFNCYGPGEKHKGKMASIISQILNRTNKTDPFPLFPKRPKRDFVYIKDVVDACIFAANNNIERGIYEVGSGESRTFEDILDLLNIKYFYLSEEDIPSWYQFETKAITERFLPGWLPKYNLENGIKDYLN